MMQAIINALWYLYEDEIMKNQYYQANQLLNSEFYR